MNKYHSMKGRFFIRVLVFSVFLILESAGINYGQAKRLQFTHLKSDNGLSSSIVTSILQDHKGLVWIGTYDGLNRYDGFNFVVYRNDSDDSSTLTNNVCLLYTSDAADEEDSVDLGGRR